MCSTSKVNILRNHSLIYRRSNEGVVDEDIRVRVTPLYRCSGIRGTDNREINFITIATSGRVNKTNIGKVIIKIHQNACYSKGKTIHYSGQVETFKNFVDYKSIRVGGKEHIITNDN